MKTFLQLLLGAVLLISITYGQKWWGKRHEAQASKQSFPASLGCQSPKSLTLEYQAEVVLNAKALKLAPFPIEESITWQAQYVRTSLVNVLNRHRQGFPILITSQNFKFEILDQSEAQYGQEIVMKEAASSFKHPYLKSVQSIEHLRAKDRAKRIKYRAEISAIRCGDDLTPRFEATIPFDPFVAFWVLPENLHRDVKYYGEGRHTNPCAVETIVPIKAKDLYWYSWNPHAKYQDVDCAKELNERNAIFTVEVKVKEVRPPTTHPMEFSKLRELAKVEMGLMWGLMNNGKGVEDVKTLAEVMGTGVVPLGQDYLKNAFEKARTSIKDAAAFALITFLGSMSELLENPQVETKLNGDHVEMKVTGLLKKTGKAFEMEVLFGNTSAYSSIGYQKDYLRFLRQKDIVFYVGHSGMGDNLKMARLERNWPEEPKEYAKPYQFVGILGCYSLVDYGYDYLPKRPKGSTTDLMLGYSTKYSFMLPMAVVGLMDEFAGGGSEVMSEALRNNALRGDILWVDRFTI